MATLRSTVSAVDAVIVARLPSDPFEVCVRSTIACEIAGHAITTSNTTFAIDLPTSHQTAAPNERLMPLNTLRRPKSGLSFFTAGCNPTCPRPTTTPMSIIPTSIGARMPAAFIAASPANCMAPAWLGCAIASPMSSRMPRIALAPARQRHLEEEDRHEHPRPRLEVGRLGDLAFVARLLDPARRGRFGLLRLVGGTVRDPERRQ